MQIEPSLRASDADREQVAGRLRQATAEGRLAGDELEERLEALYAARTYGELDALLVDLPVSRPPGGQQRDRLRRSVAAVSAVTLVVAVLGLFAVVRVHKAVAALGTVGTGPRRLTLAGPLIGTGPRHLNLPGPLTGPDPGLIVGVALGAALSVVLLTSAVLVWALMDRRSRGHRPIAKG